MTYEDMPTSVLVLSVRTSKQQVSTGFTAVFQQPPHSCERSQSNEFPLGTETYSYALFLALVLP